MKKIFLILTTALMTFGCGDNDDAPKESNTDPGKLIVINKTTGLEITDGSTIDISASTLKFYYKNTTTASKNIKIKFVEYSGVDDATGLEMCFGNNNGGACITGNLIDGVSYPNPKSQSPSNYVMTVPANGVTGDKDNQNKISSISAAGATYVFEVYEYNSADEEVGNKIRFTCVK